VWLISTSPRLPATPSFRGPAAIPAVTEARLSQSKFGRIASPEFRSHVTKANPAKAGDAKLRG